MIERETRDSTEENSYQAMLKVAHALSGCTYQEIMAALAWILADMLIRLKADERPMLEQDFLMMLRGAVETQGRVPEGVMVN